MSSSGRTNRGFTLLETVVATGVLLVCLGGVAPLFLAAAKANQHGRGLTIGTLLAAEKLEELRFEHPALGGALNQSVPGFSNLHGATGELLAEGHPVSGAIHVRRWSIATLASRPTTFVYQVRVVSPGGEIWLVGIRRRSAS
jgi:prepilin-type N-terminal cleavage/methylation domain-containing protein